MSGKTQGHLTMRTERPQTASAMWLRLIVLRHLGHSKTSWTKPGFSISLQENRILALRPMQRGSFLSGSIIKLSKREGATCLAT